ncbi:MAG: SH3 domain-containing protein [Treponema sp.]|uniref:SH3 domain-containing protein n=1 Tax=Treponema sp. TaxID=166 RepID=UPI0025F8BFA5|nr:SH3 domain-containing protein [Treponema sp.]MBR0494558.1 SH3 domain-containing protein [Treponema sp.]
MKKKIVLISILVVVLLPVVFFAVVYVGRDRIARYYQNSQEYDRSITFDKKIDYEKLIKKQKLTRKTDDDGIERWYNEEGIIRKQVEVREDGYKETSYYDENQKIIFHKSSDGYKAWWAYDENGREIRFKNNRSGYNNSDEVYEYFETPRYSLVTKQKNADGTEEWKYTQWHGSMGDVIKIYEKFSDGSEKWYDRNPFKVTVARSGFSENLDKENCREVSESESKAICKNADEDGNQAEILSTIFKTKCHFTHADEENRDSYHFYNDGETFSVHDNSPAEASELNFPLDMPPFTALELYYHYPEDSMDGRIYTDYRILDGWKVVDDIRFVGQQYIATDSLKIRSEQSLNSEQIGRVIKDELVTIIEIGGNTVIDDIESAWVKIQTKDGLEGWCFAGYLTDGTEYHTKAWTSMS